MKKFHRLMILACVYGLSVVPLYGQPYGQLRAGAAKADITPQIGVSLDGPISKNGPVIGVHDPLYARALLLDDSNSKLGLVICDACTIGEEVIDAAKKMVQTETGLSTDCVLIAATHTHAAVRATHIGRESIDDEYHRLMARRIADAVVQAEQNLAPARIAFGSFEKPEFVRCRRFLCEPGTVGVNPFGDSGERIKSVAGHSSSIIKPAGPVDPQFSILSIQHADGKPLAVLGNYSVHYSGGYRRGTVSADYFGHYASALESLLDSGESRPAFVGLMTNGTSGNTGSIERGGKEYQPFEGMKIAARALARETMTVVGGLDHRNNVSLANATSELGSSRPPPERRTIRMGQQRCCIPARCTLSASLDEDLRPRSVAPQQVPSHENHHVAGISCRRCWDRRHSMRSVCGDRAGDQTGESTCLYLHHCTSKRLRWLSAPTQQHNLGGYETWPARSSFLEWTRNQKSAARLCNCCAKQQNRTSRMQLQMKVVIDHQAERVVGIGFRRPCNDNSGTIRLAIERLSDDLLAKHLIRENNGLF